MDGTAGAADVGAAKRSMTVHRDRDGGGSLGSYGSSPFFGDDAAPVWGHVLTTAVVLLVAAVNIAGAKFIDRVQSLIVLILLAVFAVFIVVTLAQLDAGLLAPSTYPPGLDIVSSVALTFFAFLGFAVISFTGADLPDPARNLGRGGLAAGTVPHRRRPAGRRVPARRRHGLRHGLGAPGGHRARHRLPAGGRLGRRHPAAR